MSSFKLISLLLLCVLQHFLHAQTGPGGVGNSSSNKIWLSADAGIITAGSDNRVGIWLDQSGNKFDAVQSWPGNKPAYEANGINGLPYIHFDRTSAIQYLELTTVGIRDLITYNHTMFVVGRANSGGINSTETNQGFLVVPGYHSGIGVSGYPETTTAFMTHWVGVWHNGKPTRQISINTSLSQGSWNIFSRRMAQNSNGVTQTGYLNGNLFGSVSDPLLMTNYSPQLMRIGTGSTSGINPWALNGDISEVIVYNKALNEAERILVENYLSSKYHLAIGNDRFAFDAGGEFHHHVAGIGRVNASNIHTSSTSDIVNISNPTALSDDEFILLGHNDQQLVLNNSDAPSGMNRLDRVWRIDVTGTPGDVVVMANVNSFSLSSGQNFKLLVDHDGQFTDATTYSGTVDNGRFTVDTPVPLSDGTFLTLAYDNVRPSAPVSLSYSPDKVMLIYASSYSTPAPQVADGGATPAFSLIDPPTGVAINPETGSIQVDGASAGTYILSVSVSNAHGSSSFNDAYTLVIHPFLASHLAYSAKTISFGNNIEPVLPNLPANAFQYTVTSGSLNGLVLNGNTGEITGYMQTEGKVSITIKATPKAPNATGNAITTALSLTALGATGPGGVGSTTNNKIWLDANALIGLTNGTRLSTFQDRSGNGWNAVQNTASSKPTYFSGHANGKPAIRFDRSIAIQSMTVTSPGVASLMSGSNSILIVAKANAGSRSSSNPLQSLVIIPGFHSGICFLGYPTTTGAFLQNYVGGKVYGDTPDGTIQKSAGLAQGTWNLLSRTLERSRNITSQSGFINGAEMGSPTTSSLPITAYTTDLIRIGAGDLTGTGSLPLHGDIAEMIFYNTSLNEAQRIIVENYMAAKYNLTTTNDKYVAHDPAYTLDVEGIGTTDGSDANKHSVAFNSKGLKLEEINSSLDVTDEFLLAGHGSYDNALVYSDVQSITSERWQRIWYIEKNGTIDAKISFDFSDGGINLPSNLEATVENYRLLFRTTTSEPFTAMDLAASREQGDQISFVVTNENLLNGYYTLGYSGLVWTGAQNEQWNVPGNWNLNRVPITNDRVIVNTCTNCPALSGDINISGLRLNSGSLIKLNNHTLSIAGEIFIDQSRIESDNGQMHANDFSEVKQSTFVGAIVLEKQGGNINAWYGGNNFSPHLKMINSSSQEWRVATQAANVIQSP